MHVAACWGQWASMGEAHPITMLNSHSACMWQIPYLGVLPRPGVGGWSRGVRFLTALAVPPFFPECVFPPVQRGPEYSGKTLQGTQSIVMIRFRGMIRPGGGRGLCPLTFRVIPTAFGALVRRECPRGSSTAFEGPARFG